jgi:hypothetical protein
VNRKPIAEQRCSGCGEMGHKVNRCGRPNISQGIIGSSGRRSNRRRSVDRPRARSIRIRTLSREALMHGRLLYPPVDIPRPRNRSECPTERPCPWVACKHHLYLDINPETGSIKINFPDLEPWELKHTCALDIAEMGGITLEEAGEVLNLTREQIRNIEVRGLLKLKLKNETREIGSGPFVPHRDEAVV